MKESLVEEKKVTEPGPEAIRSSRRKLLALVAVAFVPLFIAYGLYFYLPVLAPEGTTNQGQLINPPLDAAQINPELATTGRWELVIPARSSCDASCEQILYLSRQVIAGLGKNSDRVQRTILFGSAPDGAFTSLIEREHPQVRRLQGQAEELLSMDQSWPLIFLMDPNGNIMMFYRLDQAGKPMQQDLKHLLKISNIG